MSRLEIIDVVADILFIFFLILNSVYVKALEKELNALKSWIEVFWKIDFGKVSEAVERLKKESRGYQPPSEKGEEPTPPRDWRSAQTDE